MSWFPAGIVGAIRSGVGAAFPVLFLPNSFALWPAFIQKAPGFVRDYFTSIKLMGVGWVNGEEFPWKMGMCRGLPACPCCATTQDPVLPP